MESANSSEDPGDRPLVLVVDDHESQRTLFKLLADRLQITAHTVKNGEEALEAVETFAFDAILMDLMMPKMDGCECTEQIRKIEETTGKHVPIIAVTARVLPEDRIKCLDAGMDDYLSKPFTLTELQEKLDSWIKRPSPSS
jgi:CheY-like chemotaxis protein